MSMEMLRNFFTDGGRVIEAYSAYDMADRGRPVVQDLMSAKITLYACFALAWLSLAWLSLE